MSNKTELLNMQDESVAVQAGVVPLASRDAEMGMEQEIANNAAKVSSSTHIRDVYIKSLRKHYNAPEGEYTFEGWARGFKKVE